MHFPTALQALCLALSATLSQAQNYKGDSRLASCCRANGMPARCMSLCKYDGPVLMACDKTCAPHLEKWIYCSLNGADMSQCCSGPGGGLSSTCSKFCNGANPGGFPKLRDMFSSLATATKYIDCFAKGARIVQCADKQRDVAASRAPGRSWASNPVPPYMNQKIGQYCGKWKAKEQASHKAGQKRGG